MLFGISENVNKVIVLSNSVINFQCLIKTGSLKYFEVELFCSQRQSGDLHHIFLHFITKLF